MNNERQQLQLRYIDFYFLLFKFYCHIIFPHDKLMVCLYLLKWRHGALRHSLHAALLSVTSPTSRIHSCVDNPSTFVFFYLAPQPLQTPTNATPFKLPNHTLSQPSASPTNLRSSTPTLTTHSVAQNSPPLPQQEPKTTTITIIVFSSPKFTTPHLSPAHHYSLYPFPIPIFPITFSPH